MHACCLQCCYPRLSKPCCMARQNPSSPIPQVFYELEQPFGRMCSNSEPRVMESNAVGGV